MNHYIQDNRQHDVPAALIDRQGLTCYVARPPRAASRYFPTNIRRHPLGGIYDIMFYAPRVLSLQFTPPLLY